MVTAWEAKKAAQKPAGSAQLRPFLFQEKPQAFHSSPASLQVAVLFFFSGLSLQCCIQRAWKLKFFMLDMFHR